MVSITRAELRRLVKESTHYVPDREAGARWWLLFALDVCEKCGATRLLPNTSKVQCREDDLRPLVRLSKVPDNEVHPTRDGDYACELCIQPEELE